MGEHSIVEAKNQLSALIEKALRGQRVVITRHGLPVVEMSPFRKDAQPRSGKETIAWLKERRPAAAMPDLDAGELVSRMRDDDWP